MKKYTQKQLPLCEQPYEKCEHFGASSLSDAELLAIIIKTGTKEEKAVDLACRILNILQGGLIGLYHVNIRDLMKVKGIGRVKALQLICIGELSKRISKHGFNHEVQFNSSTDIASFFMEDMRHLEKEILKLVLVDTKNRMIKCVDLFIGTVNMTCIEPREIFIEALRLGAVSIVILHNHPSGDPKPSSQDITSTRRLRDAGNLIGVKLLDHVIIGDRRYFSMKDAGVI